MKFLVFFNHTCDCYLADSLIDLLNYVRCLSSEEWLECSIYECFDAEK